MSNQTMATDQDRPRTKVINRTNASVPVYGLGFVGALIYFVQHATTFGLVLLGILKAIVWPALLIYKALEMLKL